MKEKKNWHTYASDAKLLSVVVDDSSSGVSGGDFPLMLDDDFIMVRSQSIEH